MRDPDAFLAGYPAAILDSARSGATIVFPSQIAAEHWRRSLVRSGALAAVRQDRIIAWDRFKEQAFDLRTELLPANRTLRSVFADGVVRRNAESRFFRSLIPPSSAGNARAFTRLVTQTLAHLSAAGLLDRARAGSLVPAGLADDLAELRRRYAAFLSDHRLYEPGWLSAAPAYRGGRYVLVEPSLAEDWPEFAPALREVPCISCRQSRLPVLDLYEDARSELSAVLERIAVLLDSGAPADSLVLSVCGLDQLSTRLRQAGELAALPLDFRAGYPLAESAAGRLFAALGPLISSGFGLDAVKALLLSRAVPWRDYRANLALVESGARHGCLGGTRGPDPRWNSVRDDAAKRIYRLLRGGVPSLASASSAAELQSRLYPFLDRIIDRDRWAADDERPLERCLEELRELADIERDHGIRVPDPLAFWVARLSEQLYVPRRAERGVAVLPYRVGAGLRPEHHFLLNAHHVATRVRVTRLPFLTDAERESLGDQAADRDLTRDFIEAYAGSGAAVHFSASRTTFDGPGLAPGAFVAQGQVQSAGLPPGGAPAGLSLLLLEERFDAPPPSMVLPVQRSGARAYAGLADRVGPDLTRSPLQSEELRAEVLAQQSAASGVLRLSATQTDAHRACPFSYLLSHVLGLRELELTVDPDSARDLGSLYHRVLERFFGALRDSGERFSAARVDEYRTELLRLAGEEADRWTGMTPGFVLQANAELVRRVLDRLLELDCELIDGHAPVSVEGWRERTDVVPGVMLVGRVDRITRAPDGGLTLVDYKKRRVASAKSQYGSSAEPTGVARLPPDEREAEADLVGSIQIPLYVRMIEASGARVATAAYYSLEDGKAIVVASDSFGAKTVMTRERLLEIELLVEDIVARVAKQIREGDYRCGECEGCEFRGVCRSRFVVR